MLNIFQKTNEISLSKFIWLIVDDFDESNLNSKEYYIPYNSELLILKNKRDDFFIEEYYHPSWSSIYCFNRHFGIWKQDKGLEIFEHDIYKRRLDMEGTVLSAHLHVCISIE